MNSLSLSAENFSWAVRVSGCVQFHSISRPKLFISWEYYIHILHGKLLWMGSRFYAYFLLYFFFLLPIQLNSPTSLLEFTLLQQRACNWICFFPFAFFFARFVPCDFCFSLFGAFWLYVVLFCFDSVALIFGSFHLYSYLLFTSQHHIIPYTHRHTHRFEKFIALQFFFPLHDIYLCFETNKRK